MGKNDGALRAMLEELDAELERRSKIDARAMMASGSGMHWIAERSSRHGLTPEQTTRLIAALAA